MFLYKKHLLDYKMKNTPNRIPVKIPLFSRIKNPMLLESILEQIPDGFILGEYLNRVIGGVYYEFIRKEELPAELTSSDPTRQLKSHYNKDDIVLRLNALRGNIPLYAYS